MEELRDEIRSARVDDSEFNTHPSACWLSKQERLWSLISVSYDRNDRPSFA